MGEQGGGPIQYELRIGVTGHRDLTYPNEVKGAVRELLQHVVTVLENASAEPFGPNGSPQSRIDCIDRALTRILAGITYVLSPLLNFLMTPLRWIAPIPTWPRVPYSTAHPDPNRQTPLKLTVISALAEGADQIVARTVCDMVRWPEQRNRYLEAVLPFHPTIYEEDFEDVTEFRELLSYDKGRENTHPEPTILFPDFPECPDPADKTITLTRDRAYEEAGRYVVDTAEIIIAIWDPSRPHKPGGTGVTVQYALDCGRIVLWLNPADLVAGWFLLRPAPSKVDKKSETKRWPVRLLQSWRHFWHEASELDEKDVDDARHRQVPSEMTVCAVPARAKQLSRNFHRLAAYNRDSAMDDEAFQRELGKQTTKIEKAATTNRLPPKATPVIIETFLPQVVRADYLSLRYKELRKAAARLWPTAAALVVSLMALQIIFLPGWYCLAFVELGVLLLGYASYRVSLYEAWHEKWLNDRRLAEGLRAAMFAALVLSEQDGAARPSVKGALDRIQDPLPFYNPANAWFVATLKRFLSKERRRFAGKLDINDADERKAVALFLRDAWVLAQAKHHEEHAEHRRHVVEWSKRLRLAMIVTLTVVATLHAFGVGHTADHLPSFTRLALWVAFATVALPAWAAASHVMLSLDDHERLAERSALMVPLMHGLAGRLEEADSVARLRLCVADAERVTDLESREWAESLADRRPEFTG